MEKAALKLTGTCLAVEELQGQGKSQYYAHEMLLRQPGQQSQIVKLKMRARLEVGEMVDDLPVSLTNFAFGMVNFWCNFDQDALDEWDPFGGAVSTVVSSEEE